MSKNETTEEKDTYELMLVLHTTPNPPWDDGIDSSSCDVGDALGIIRWLLKHDAAVKGWKLAKKPKKKTKKKLLLVAQDGSTEVVVL